MHPYLDPGVPLAPLSRRRLFLWSAGYLHAITGALFFHLLTTTCEELAWCGYAFWGLMHTLGHWPAQLIVELVATYRSWWG